MFYPLTLADELGDEHRPWGGKLYLFAVYARALTLSEVETNLGVGVARLQKR